MIKKDITSLEVSEIIVEQLFGIYDYYIPMFRNKTEIEQLLIIYGDNGCGKTTILKLFFYILSTKDGSGYKTKIAETKFKKFIIKFKNGVEIGAMRDESTIGSFNYYISSKEKDIYLSAFLKTSPQNEIIIGTGTIEEEKYLSILKYIEELNITTFYLSDDRKILNTKTSKDFEDYTDIGLLNDSKINFAKSYDRIAVKRILNEKRLFLEPSIERLIDWIKSKTIVGSRKGEQNSQTIFSDIIRNYISLSEFAYDSKDKKLILEDIIEIEKALPSYVSLGLIDNIDLKIVKSSISKAKTEEQIKFLNTVVKPYIDSIKAKLDALEKIQNTIKLFIDTINDYFSNKKIEFHLTSGISIEQKNTLGDYEDVEFEWLSSGEKQLLLLLINTITASDDATIFIIDEPEISLNIKWQRKLIKTLLKFSEHKNTQFILATHSIELLSTYKNNINRLENIIDV